MNHLIQLISFQIIRLRCYKVLWLWMRHYQGYKKWSNYILQKAADLNIKLWLENDSNVKVDRASMAYSVEVRSPFLNYRVVEYARTLPVSFRYKKGRQKRYPHQTFCPRRNLPERDPRNNCRSNFPPSPRPRRHRLPACVAKTNRVMGEETLRSYRT